MDSDNNNNQNYNCDIYAGANDTLVCSTPNDYILYFGTLRKVFDGDIVVALESGYSPEIKGTFIM